MNDKIEDNPSFKKLNENLNGAEALKQIVSAFAPFFQDADNILKSLGDLPELQNNFNDLSKSPDEFNSLFSDLGWIAHESMNHELMLESITLAKNEGIKVAEEKLADYYTSENLNWLTSQMNGTPEFQKRYELIRLAYEDTIAQRFHSAVPVILMIIDGGVNDIDKNKGFFTETTDLTAWDSIAAHSTGLSRLRDILNKGRNRTNTEEIFLPYRNGILHGRDIYYANKYVAAKCWLTLIAINDWAKAIRDGKKKPPEEKEKPSFEESLNELKGTLDKYKKQQKENEEIKQQVEQWKPRNLNIGEDIPIAGKIEDYQEFTPERDAVKFINNWKNKNYGAIVKQINYFNKEINFGKEAGRVRGIFDKKNIKDFKLKSIIDCAPAISEVFIDVQFEFEQKEYNCEIKLRMIYQNENGDNMVIGRKNGDWKFIDSFFFHKIEYPETL